MLEISNAFNNASTEISMFLAGAIGTRKAPYTAVYKVFMFFFFFHRLYLFLQQLKDPAFRSWLKRMAVTALGVLLTIMSILVTISMLSGCKVQVVKPSKNVPDVVLEEQEPDVSSMPDMSVEDSLFKLKKKTSFVDALIVSAQAVSNAKKKKVSNVLNVPRSEDLTKAKEIDNSNDSTFKRSLKVKTCDGLQSVLLANAKRMGNICKVYSKVIMSYSIANIDMKEYKRYAINSCEKYGTSFLFRLRTGATKISDRWKLLSSWNTSKIQLTVAGDVYRNSTIRTVVALNRHSIATSLKFKNCRMIEKDKFFSNTIFGFIPTRSLK